MFKKIDSKIISLICQIDKLPLWILGIILEIIVFIPYIKMGTASVFPWHDQLDENILNYVLTARHLFDGSNTIPEMMNGLPASSLQPYSILFLPLYLVFSPFVSFVVTYAIVFAIAFWGMYFCIYEITASNILSVIIAGVFSMLPFWPVYGIAVAGVPLAVYAIICIEKKKNILVSFIGLTLFGLGSHLVFTGYCVLAFWLLWFFYCLNKKRLNYLSVLGFFYLIAIFVLVNIDLFKELIFGEEGYVSHRSEFVNQPVDLKTAISHFIYSDQHAESYHSYLIVPIILLLILGGILYHKMSAYKKIVYAFAVSGFVSLVLIAVWGGIFRSRWVSEWRNAQDNIFHYFSLDRFFWLYPSLWLIVFALCIYVFWDLKHYALVQILFLGVLLLPTAKETLDNSYYYMSVNETNNGYSITGYIPWENYYSEDVMSDIEKAIGREMSTYKVAHIGINPTPALMHGFYTIDGYAGTYPLEYKHAFREIIETELEIFPEAALYFDYWGSRCYLFNSQTGDAFMVGKTVNAKLTDLKFNWNKLKEMECEYLFSCGEITDYSDSGLEFIGSYSSDSSYWNIWVYEIK